MAPKNMKVAAAAVVVALAAAYPASSWYFGKQIEAAHAEMDAKIAALPYLKLVRHEYERGLFSASEVITVEIPTAMFRLPAPQKKAAEETPAPEIVQETAPGAPVTAQPAPASPPAAPLPPLRFTIRTTIQHGPLPGFDTLAAGRASSVIEFEEPIQKKVAEAFSGKPALDIQTLYDFQGGGHATITSPALKIVLPGHTENSQAILSGDGLEMVMEFTKSMEQYTLRGSAPRFELSEPSGPRMIMTGLRLESRQQRMFQDDPLLYSGSQQISLAELSIDPGTNDEQKKTQKVALKELKYDVQVPASGEFIDLIARFGATGVQIGEQNYGPANYDFSLKHVHARKLMALNRSLMALYTKPEVMQDSNLMMQALAPMKDQFIALLLDNPVLSIDRIGFRTPEGEAKLSASVKLIDAKAEDFSNPMLLLTKLEAAADIALPTALVSTLAGNKAEKEEEEEALLRKQKTEQTMANIVQQGYATLDGNLLKSRIAFKAGQLLVNDKPFNPLAMAQPKPQEGMPPAQ